MTRLLPPARRRTGVPLFAPVAAARELRIVVDDGVLPADPRVTPEGILAGLMTHEAISVLRYRDDGPDASVQRAGVEVPELAAVMSAPVGWLEVVGDPRGTREGWARVRWADSGGTHVAAFIADAVTVAREDSSSLVYATLSDAAASARRAADAVAVLAAQSRSADLFITERPYLHDVKWPLAEGLLCVRPSEALAIVGLYLRARREFLIWKDPLVTSTVTRATFYIIGARALLPSNWGWAAACLLRSKSARDDRLALLASTVLQRVARALQARDDLLLALSRQHDRDTDDDVLTAIDVALIFLCGAIDAAARVVHYALHVPGDAHRAKWHEDTWRRAVRERVPGGGVFLQPDSELDHAFTLMRALRNTVHGIALQPLIRRSAPGTDRLAIDLPATSRATVEAAASGAGGHDAWGLQVDGQGRMLLEPIALCDKIFSTGLEVIDRYLRAVSFDLLAGEVMPAEEKGPPTTEHDTVFGPISRASVCWQLGTSA